MSPEKIRRLFDYDPLTGILRWKISKARRIRPGDIVGTYSEGRLNVTIDYCVYKVHRICWAHYYGIWPTNEIDHEDRNGLNNKIKNLRDATRTQNMGNTKAHKDSIYGLKGVSRVRAKYVARIRGRRIGLYNTPEEAHTAYCIEAKKEFGEFFCP